ncbi:MAG: hypothetical protein IT459_08350 [Planctomycetes bacterium]|nr:hypothetical protein [Planctomycetota bacterium]
MVSVYSHSEAIAGCLNKDKGERRVVWRRIPSNLRRDATTLPPGNFANLLGREAQFFVRALEIEAGWRSPPDDDHSSALCRFANALAFNCKPAAKALARFYTDVPAAGLTAATPCWTASPALVDATIPNFRALLVLVDPREERVGHRCVVWLPGSRDLEELRSKHGKTVSVFSVPIGHRHANGDRRDRVRAGLKQQAIRLAVRDGDVAVVDERGKERTTGIDEKSLPSSPLKKSLLPDSSMRT